MPDSYVPLVSEKQISVKVPLEVWQWYRMHAIERGTSLQAVVLRALEDYRAGEDPGEERHGPAGSATEAAFSPSASGEETGRCGASMGVVAGIGISCLLPAGHSGDHDADRWRWQSYGGATGGGKTTTTPVEHADDAPTFNDTDTVLEVASPDVVAGTIIATGTGPDTTTIDALIADKHATGAYLPADAHPVPDDITDAIIAAALEEADVHQQQDDGLADREVRRQAAINKMAAARTNKTVTPIPKKGTK